jgi:hypothetical protein
MLPKIIARQMRNPSPIIKTMVRARARGGLEEMQGQADDDGQYDAPG